MITDFEELVKFCDDELIQREYDSKYYDRIKDQWKELRQWLQRKGINEFSEDIGKEYCLDVFGTYLMPRCPPVRLREKLRSIRMLISYQKNGTFEFRSPSTEYIFSGIIGKHVLDYLRYCETDMHFSERTINNKKLYLHDFAKYMKIQEWDYASLSIDRMEEFFHVMNYSLSSRHNAAMALRIFFKYIYDQGYSTKDCSVFILPDNYKKNCKLPTTYEEEEIRQMIASIERASSIGKRDYLIVLLAAQYGWRAKDITHFSFEDIDWDNNLIRFNQSKTDTAVVFPLLSSVGNAIIDYLKNARPQTDVPEILVSMENANKGKPLSSPTIHSIISKYMKRACIKDWDKKKHGPHSMRHSLATNLLKKNVAMPIISTVMGHQRTETTNIYISVDYDHLKKCVLPMPTLHSSFYTQEVHHGKI